MRRDVNVVILTGTILSKPSWFPLKNNKRALIFTLQNCEHYHKSTGESAVHRNEVVVEILGRNAERYFNELSVQQRCQVTGYLRSDEIKGLQVIRVRALHIVSEDGGE